MRLRELLRRLRGKTSVGIITSVTCTPNVTLVQVTGMWGPIVLRHGDSVELAERDGEVVLSVLHVDGAREPLIGYPKR